MYSALPDLFAALDADPDVKVIVVRGAGDEVVRLRRRHQRVRARSAATPRPHKATTSRSPAAEHAIEGVTKPTIAMVHGYCIGGGGGLALACDLRFADDRRASAITPAKLGLVYSLESTKRLVDLVGPSRAKWILMSGQHIPAERAYSSASSTRSPSRGPREAHLRVRRAGGHPCAVQRPRGQADGRADRAGPVRDDEETTRAAQLARSTPRTTPRACARSSRSVAEVHLAMTSTDRA